VNIYWDKPAWDMPAWDMPAWDMPAWDMVSQLYEAHWFHRYKNTKTLPQGFNSAAEFSAAEFYSSVNLATIRSASVSPVQKYKNSATGFLLCRRVFCGRVLQQHVENPTGFSLCRRVFCDRGLQQRVANPTSHEVSFYSFLFVVKKKTFLYFFLLGGKRVFTTH
jgi:hypothetical protein